MAGTTKDSRLNFWLTPADDERLELDDSTWGQFIALIDAPTLPNPRLVELFARPQRIAR